ncbi:MAG: hypothetical protein Q8P45_03415, partial [Candidatus Harrisonbacteria bacterium]|nr:hypothetical protein [Candidatus Harrisonbacteria bacterium]
MARGLRSYIPNLFRFFQWLGKVQLRPLAVYCHHSQHWLFLFDTSDEKNIYRLPFSGSHFDFKKRQKVEWTLPSGLGINPKLCRSIHFFEKGRKHHLSFLYQEGSHRYLGLASSTNLKRFKTESLKPLKVNSLALVPSQGGYLAVFGKDSIGLAQSEDLNQWEMIDKQLIQARKDYFDSGSIRLLSAIERKEGILVLYDTTREHTLSIGAVIVAKSNPGHILWRSDSALWEEELGASSLSPLGVCADRGIITAYYLSSGGKILSTQFRSPFSRFREGRQSPSLKRSDSNPIIEPRKENGWEAEAAFNPAAWYDGNVVHLLYRAVG